MAGPRVLLIEDDDALRDGVAASLRSRGYEVVALRDGVAIDRELDEFDPEVAVLDIGLVDGPDGFTLGTVLAKRASGPPFVFMTAAGGIEDRLRGFDLGAEDYIVKPFSTRELDSRLQVILRRRERPAPGVDTSDLVLDLAARTAHRAGSDLGLTPTELELLVALRSVQGRVWSKRELLRQVWGTDHHSTHIVEVYISNLRRKLEEHGPRIIVTHRAGGYSLRS